MNVSHGRHAIPHCSIADGMYTKQSSSHSEWLEACYGKNKRIRHFNRKIDFYHRILFHPLQPTPYAEKLPFAMAETLSFKECSEPMNKIMQLNICPLQMKRHMSRKFR